MHLFAGVGEIVVLDNILSKFLLLAAISACALAVNAEVYVTPEIKSDHKIKPNYPKGYLKKGREGWVIFNVMVDNKGVPYEAEVVDYVGGKAFISAARKALEESRFTPGTLDDVAVDSGTHFKYTFSIAGGIGASRKFKTLYKKFSEAIQAKNIEKAEEYLVKLEGHKDPNNYETAFLNFAKFQYGVLSGDSKSQMLYLNRALAYESAGKKLNYLDEEFKAIARRQLFILQVKNKYFADALDTYAELEKNNQQEFVELFKEPYKSILALKENDQGYEVPLELSDSGFVFHKLLKQSIALFDVEGGIDTLKLRCRRKYIYFDYSPNKQWNIPKEWGSCFLQVVGEPNSRFVLAQS